MALEDTATPQADAPNSEQVPVEQSLSDKEELVLKVNSKAGEIISAAKVPAIIKVSEADGVASVSGAKWNGAGGGRGAQGGPTAEQAAQNTGIAAYEVPTPRPNPLHEYATYTYGLTLYILSQEDFNKLQQADANQLDSWKPTKSLISSAGNHAGDERHADFKDDFYFDSFKMSTIVGMNSITRGSNAITLNFTLIEPYGLTLLDRTIEAAKSVGSQNYLSQPYLLEIDFYGAKDLGDITAPIRNLRKRIPIQMIEMKIKAGVKGSEYAITCIPYNHGAFSENSVSTPANFEVTASTVSDFFKNTLTNLTSQIAARDKAKSDAERASKPSSTASNETVYDEQGNVINSRVVYVETPPDQKAVDAANKIINSPYQVESYPGAVNAWNQKIIDSKHYSVSNEVEFVIDPAFANSKIVDPNKTSPSRTAFSSEGASDKKASAQGNDPNISNKTPTADYNKNKMTFNVNAGTSIIDVINMVMRNSEYIKRQVIDPEAGEIKFAEDRTVDYFKIIPQVFLKAFDPLRNSYATRTVYHVKKYSYFNSKHPNLPYGTPDGPVKQYDYIYTGKNIDILDFAIDFNTAFYTAKVVNNSNKDATNPAPEANADTKDDKPGRPNGSGPNSIAGNQSKPVPTQTNVSTNGADTAKTALVGNAMDSIYSSPRGDMIQVKLKILGDPHFVKQDDLYTNPGMANYTDKKVMINTGTLAMDAKEIFCRLSFKTPVDMDESTGLLRTDGKFTVSKFTGLYKIIQVESEFSRGQFVQTLDCIRIFEKPESSKVYESDERQDQTNAVVSKDSTGDGARQLKITDNPAIAPPEIPSAPSMLDKIKTAEETFVKKTMATVQAVTDEVLSTAKNIRDKISADLRNAPSMDIGEKKAEDNSSPEPETPQI